MNKDVAAYYSEKVDLAEKEIVRLDKRINFYSFLRVLVLVAATLLMWQSVKLEIIWTVYFSIFLGILAFAYLVNKQSKFSAQKQFNLSLKKVNQNELGSLKDRSTIYDDGTQWIDDNHSYTSDLDIFGKLSLYSLVNRCATSFGKLEMAEWLKDSSSKVDVGLRQKAAIELATKKNWKMHFQANLLFAHEEQGKSNINGLFNYLETSVDLHKSWIAYYVKFVPYVFYGAAIGAYFYPPFLLLMFLSGLANITLVLAYSGKVNQALNMTGKAGQILSKYSDAFRMIEDEKWESPLCITLSKTLNPSGSAQYTLSHQVKKLAEILGRLEYRLNMFVGPILNISMAWDVKQYLQIQEWKINNKEHIKNAFHSVGSFECLLSIAGLHINYPDWCFPAIQEDEYYTLTAQNIGHPLIQENVRILNNFHLQDELKIDIITGSNMAGKSTFLRTLGINAVLAFCGAPVCAHEMRLTNMKIFTYMRIKDSLNESISTFKAELNRLQLLLDVLNSGEKVYFLIDEMLRGTNSVDKYLGSKAIIERLIEQKSVGIVATHDLQIANLEDEYPAYIRNFYFDIKVIDEEMMFDYKLKKGACKTFNASLLLRKLGILVHKEEL
ncbi:MutS-related protein [Arcticibacter eurypsychrophilus]|uniref:MutS-related protein n=1 Tax=Arcticibacter eurypsychrophilus TaxID=1434752 RepID=UPI00084DB4C9|nr:hypothetical protein [Arcticibacter eurypsychrophilus]